MKQSIAITALAASAVAVPLGHDHHWEFKQYCAMFNKSYDNYDEYKFRLEAFKVKNDLIKEHNASGEHSFTLGHNQFSDWTEEEYTNFLTYAPEPQELFEQEMGPGAKKGAAHSPIDWRQYGYVTDVKDQGHCGSCWAFSSTGALEGAHARMSGQLLSFSEQQLVDCVKGCFGCGGGNVNSSFSYYQKHPAIQESVYPYTHKNGRCQDSQLQNTGVTDGGHMKIHSNSPDAMKDALTWWPISVAIQANKPTFQNYRGGLYDDTSCGTRLDHATLVVGWGKEGGSEYWIMKNSWGKTWGEQGYMRLKVVSGNGICGIQKQPSAPQNVN